MARPLRIEFAGAVYHVTARGNARKPVVRDDGDRRQLLVLLHQTTTRFQWRCYAYCLMRNHYHLLIETPEGNLSRGMRHLNGVYTQRFNRRHHRVGHVFQGRFKAILIQKESHLLEVCRYVVLNPVRATHVRTPEQWRWSSYRATAGLEAPPPWLSCDWIWEQFGSRRQAAAKRYRAFVRDGIGAPSLWNQVKGQSLLGEESYVKRLAKYLRRTTTVKEFPRAQRYLHRPTLTDLFKGAAARDRQQRNRLIAVAVLEHGYTQTAIADHLGLHYSTVSRRLSERESRTSRFKT